VYVHSFVKNAAQDFNDNEKLEGMISHEILPEMRN
jgi:hypothetical protein